MKGKGNKEDEKRKDEDEYKPQPEMVVDEAWSLPYDEAFHNLVKEAVESISPLQDVLKCIRLWPCEFIFSLSIHTQHPHGCNMNK